MINLSFRRRYACYLVGIFLTGILIVSCKRETAETPKTPASGKSKELVISLEANPVTLDPMLMTDVNSASVGTAIHSTLVRIDAKGQIMPMLADEVRVASDGLSADVKLHPGATFWDGSKVKEEDVEYSLARLRDSNGILKWTAERIASFERKSDTELTIRFTRPEPDFAKLIAHPQAAIVKSGTDKLEKKPFDTQVVGAGAFVPQKLEPGVAFELGVNPGFPRLNNLAKLTFRIIPDSQNQLEAIRSGKADIVRLKGPMLTEACTGRVGGSLQPRPLFAKTTIVEGQASELNFVIVNWRNPKLADISAGDRRALLSSLSAKLPRETVVSSVYMGAADLAVGVVPPCTLGSEQSVPEATASWKSPPERKLVLLAANDAASRQLATFLQPRFKEMGWELDLQFVELGGLMERLIKRDYELGLLWFEMPVAGVEIYAACFEQGNPLAAFGEEIPEVRQKLESARSIINDAERQNARAKVIGEINAAQSVWLPIISRHTVLLCSGRVDGLVLDICGTAVWSSLKVNE